MAEPFKGKIFPPSTLTTVAFVSAYHAAPDGAEVELRVASDDMGEFFIAASVAGQEGIYMLAEDNVLTIFDAIAYSNSQIGRSYAQELVDALKSAIERMRRLRAAQISAPKGTRH